MPGAIIVVKPGEKIPLDGEVVAGQSAVNQAPVTGESLPIDKAPGDEVFAGTINGRGALDVRVTRVGRDTTLARIIHLVERAQAQRAPSQTVVERFARIYTPAVIALALVVAIVPPLVVGAELARRGSTARWCCSSSRVPCALVISTPVSIVAALAGAARKGRAGQGRGAPRAGQPRAMRRLRQDRDADARGARGRRRVAARTVSAAPRLSRSPRQWNNGPSTRSPGRSCSTPPPPASRRGRPTTSRRSPAAGRRDGSAARPVVLGNHRLFEERGLCSPLIHDRLERLSADGRTAVLVARDGQAVGIIAVADRRATAARDAVDLLRRQGVESVVMLTGDSRGDRRRRWPPRLGVDEFRAELMPEDKVAAVEELRRSSGRSPWWATA